MKRKRKKNEGKENNSCIDLWPEWHIIKLMNVNIIKNCDSPNKQTNK